MICYTRNFEDVMLQRVFADVPKGNYLDVGASLPVEDSNTYALYQQGWRGVAMEPLPLEKFWRQNRPEDVFLNVAVGAQPGNVTLHVFDAAQLCSAMPDTVVHWAQHGREPLGNIQVSCVTLNQVVDEHLPDHELHILSIDVEGMEHEVLKGLDLSRHRPWVIVLEVVLPGSTTQSPHSWEPDLLAAGYLDAYFDGVNRFYLARERGHLLERFSLPPNVWDGIVLASQLALQQENENLKAELTSLRETQSRLSNAQTGSQA